MSQRASSKCASGVKLITSSIVLAVLASVSSVATACRSSQSPPQSSQADVAVNSPATGVVRSILVGDGASVEKDAAIIEIAVASEPSGEQATSQQKDKTVQQMAAASVARNNVVASEADANRALVELQRIEPLVKRGLASQAELDKARAQNQDAQARLERARERAKSAEQAGGEPSGSGRPAKDAEEIVAVRAPIAGKIHQINVQAGQQVTAGQTLAKVSGS
jgi:multidrug resistance efflux pump